MLRFFFNDTEYEIFGGTKWWYKILNNSLSAFDFADLILKISKEKNFADLVLLA